VAGHYVHYYESATRLLILSGVSIHGLAFLLIIREFWTGKTGKANGYRQKLLLSWVAWKSLQSSGVTNELAIVVPFININSW
jgi:hypothetical protein